MAGFVAPLIGAGASLFGSLLGSNQQGKFQDYLEEQVRMLWDKANQGDVKAQEILGTIINPMTQGVYNPNAMLWGYDETQGMYPELQDMIKGSIPKSQQDVFGQGFGYMPGFEEQLQELLGLRGLGDFMNQNTADIIGNRGRTPQLDEIGARSLDIGQGKGGAMGPLLDIGQQLLGQRGQTNMTMNTQDRAMDALNRGGYTPGLSELFGLGKQGVPTNLGVTGLTPTGAKAMDVGLRQLEEGGQTPATQWLQQRGMDLGGREALLPLEQVLKMSRDQVGTQGIKTYKNIIKKAMQRAGGPNAVAGSQGDVMAEFGDTLLQAEADAMRQALLGQQGLQLQQQGQGLNTVASGQELATRNLGQAGQLEMGLENAATNRLGTGGGLMSDSERTAAQLQQILGGLGIQAGGLETQRIGQGGNLLDSFLGRQLGGLSTAMQPEQLSSDNLNKAFGFQIQNAAEQRNLLNTFLTSLLAGDTQSVNRGRTFQDILGAGQNRYGNLANSLGESQLKQQGSLADIAKSWLQYSSSAFPHPNPNDFPKTSPWTSTLQGIGQGIGQGDWSLPTFGSNAGVYKPIPGMPAPGSSNTYDPHGIYMGEMKP